MMEPLAAFIKSFAHLSSPPGPLWLFLPGSSRPEGGLELAGFRQGLVDAVGQNRKMPHLPARDGAALAIKVQLGPGVAEDRGPVGSLLRGGQTLLRMPKGAILRNFALNHLVHHRAQLGVYLRMNGVPVPATYGPTADER